MLSARLAASVARNLPRSASQVWNLSLFFGISLKLATSCKVGKLHNNHLTLNDENMQHFLPTMFNK
jgi:hypothetical protein